MQRGKKEGQDRCVAMTRTVESGGGGMHPGGS
jgi:hypothetical protein